MSLEARSRMVSFRLTTEEYHRFRQLCFARGLRNVSEMVRAAVNRMVDESEVLALPHPGLEPRLADLEHRLQSLSHDVERLNRSDGATLEAPAQLSAIQHAASR